VLSAAELTLDFKTKAAGDIEAARIKSIIDRKSPPSGLTQTRGEAETTASPLVITVMAAMLCSGCWGALVQAERRD
jgi:hypothetical protein